MKYELLSSLTLPKDIKKLNIDDEKRLCEEIREKIIEIVSKNGGHLASNLGTVELSVEIHRVFDSPDDKIVFDVGHQSYAHKLLTGRFDEFDSLRCKDGLCGFMNPSESIHDPVISGHSSTSISSALGLAQGMKLKGDNHHAVAVIGDGALTGGLSYEGLNNAGRSGTNLVVILNYNEMSISKNIGGIAEYLSKLRMKKSYKKVKNAAIRMLEAVPLVGRSIKKSISFSKDIIKERLLHITLFEDLGFEYVGPVDGHDLESLESALSYAKSLNAPVMVQVNTVKGKGYAPAENNPGSFHGVSGFDPTSGVIPKKEICFSDIFGKAVARFADEDKRIVGVTAAMKYGTGLNYLNKTHPERLFDVGIAEEHAVTFCAGLAKSGMIPVFGVYSSFLQRCYDQLIHDVSLDNLHVVLGIGNAGIVGEDGQTHQGIMDVPFLSTIPNAKIYSPSCYAELEHCLNKAIFCDEGLAAVRYPKCTNLDVTPCLDNYCLVDRSSDTLIISYGRESESAEKAAKSLGCDFMKLVCIYPIENDIIDIISKYKRAFVFEESQYEGSIGQKLEARCNNVTVRAINGFVSHMKYSEAIELYGLSEKSIVDTVKADLP